MTTTSLVSAVTSEISKHDIRDHYNEDGIKMSILLNLRIADLIRCTGFRLWNRIKYC
jgi:hypothetical protein